jgi:hypothetical protein
MTRSRRWLGTFLLVGALSGGWTATASSVAVVQNPTAPSTITRAQACAQLDEYIRHLEAHPAGPLRNALLRFALALKAKCCAAAGGI